MHADVQNMITKEIMPIKHTMVSQPHILHGYTTRTPSTTLLVIDWPSEDRNCRGEVKREEVNGSGSAGLYTHTLCAGRTTDPLCFFSQKVMIGSGFRAGILVAAR